MAPKKRKEASKSPDPPPTTRRSSRNVPKKSYAVSKQYLKDTALSSASSSSQNPQEATSQPEPGSGSDFKQPQSEENIVTSSHADSEGEIITSSQPQGITQATATKRTREQVSSSPIVSTPKRVRIVDYEGSDDDEAPPIAATAPHSRRRVASVQVISSDSSGIGLASNPLAQAQRPPVVAPPQAIPSSPPDDDDDLPSDPLAIAPRATKPDQRSRGRVAALQAVIGSTESACSNLAGNPVGTRVSDQELEAQEEEIDDEVYTRPQASFRRLVERLRREGLQEPEFEALMADKLSNYFIPKPNTTNEWTPVMGKKGLTVNFTSRTKDSSHKWLIQNKQGAQIVFTFVGNLCSIDLWDSTNRTALSKAVCTFMNNWTRTAPVNKLQYLKSMIIDAAVSHISKKPFERYVRAPTWVQRRGWGMFMHYVDKNTGDEKKIKFEIAAGLELAMRLPELPSHIVLYYPSGSSDTEAAGSGGGKGRLLVPRLANGDYRSLLVKNWEASPFVKGSNTQKHLNAEAFLRYVSCQLSGLASTEAELELAYKQMLLLYSASSKRRPGPGSGLFIIHAYAGQTKRAAYAETRVRLSGFVLEHLGVEDFVDTQIKVKSLDQRWLLPPLEMSGKTYRETMSIPEAVITMGDALIATNDAIMDGQTPPADCYCADRSTSTELHTCHSCGETVMCKDRQKSFVGTWVCQKDYEKTKHIAGRNSSITQVRLKFLYSRELALIEKSLDDPVEAARLQDSLAHMQQALDDNDCDVIEYFDAYLNKKVKIGPSGSHDFPSIDAIRPFYRTSDGEYRGHVAGNIVTTSMALNSAKYTHMVGILEEIAAYRRTIQDLDNSEDRKQAGLKLLERLDTLHIITNRYSIYTATKLRAAEGASEAQWNATLKEWINADPQLGSLARDKWEKFLFRAHIAIIECPWKKKRQTLKRMINQMLEFFRHNPDDFQYSSDGFLYPYAGEMPEDFGVDVMYTLGIGRHNRMKFACNRHWNTVDTPWTIVLEMYYQALSNEPQYQEFLNLPIVLCMRHACNLSVAHKHHGSAMLSSWEQDATDLSHRHGHLNNLLMETFFSNFFKHDFAEKFYDALKEMIDNVKISKELYNPTSNPAVVTERPVATLALSDPPADDILDARDPWYEPLTEGVMQSTIQDAAEADEEILGQQAVVADKPVAKKGVPPTTTTKSTTKTKRTPVSASVKSTTPIVLEDEDVDLSDLSDSDYMSPDALAKLGVPMVGGAPASHWILVRESSSVDTRAPGVVDKPFVTADHAIYGWKLIYYDAAIDERMFADPTTHGEFIVISASARKNEVVATWDSKRKVFLAASGLQIGTMTGRDPQAFVPGQKTTKTADPVETAAAAASSVDDDAETDDVTSADTMLTMNRRIGYDVYVRDAVDSDHLMYDTMVVAAWPSYVVGYPTQDGCYRTHDGKQVASFEDDGTVVDMDGKTLGQKRL